MFDAKSLGSGVLVALLLALGACADPYLIEDDKPLPEGFFAPGPTASYDVEPRLVSGKAPLFPIRKALNHEGGYATVRFTIGKDGHTKDLEIVESTYSYFGTHMVAAIKDWVFEPAIKDGEPVEVRAQYTLNFLASGSAPTRYKQ